MNTLRALGIAMAAGLLMTRIIKLVHLPNVTAFLIAGLLIGPSVSGLISAEAIDGFDIIVNVALGFIAFSIGGEFRLSSLKSLGKRITVITGFQAFTATIFVLLILLVTGTDKSIAFTLSAIATATAPAATLLVVRQYKAKGPLTDTLLPVVALDDAFGLMIFSIFFSIAKALATGTEPSVKNMLVEPLVEIVLSLVIGAAIGALLALCCRFFKSRANRLSLCVMATVVGVALSEILSLSSLLVCMMIGALFANLCGEYEKILEGVDRWTPPLFMLFFVISGAELNLSVLPSVGIVGVLYILFRAFGKYSGAFVGAAITHSPKEVRDYLGLTLLPQAGVAVGMAQMAVAELPAEYGMKIQAVVLCATLVYEIVGPVITKISLAKAGEITVGK